MIPNYVNNVLIFAIVIILIIVPHVLKVTTLTINLDNVKFVPIYAIVIVLFFVTPANLEVYMMKKETALIFVGIRLFMSSLVIFN